jgi:cobalt transporter subunit CbtB
VTATARFLKPATEDCTMTDLIHSQATGPLAKTATLAPTLLTIMLGAFILFGTGFVQINAAHNAAHDSRHSFAFPCH